MADARLSQIAVEALIGDLPAVDLQLSQVAVECLRSSTAEVTTGQLSQVAVEVLILEITTAGQLSQLAVEVLLTAAVVRADEIRATSVAIELASAGPSTLGVTQLALEVAYQQPGEARVSQLLIEIVRPVAAAASGFVGTPGIAWMEWRGRVPEAVVMDSPALLADVLETVAYSDWDLQCPPSYYHGFKAARVESFGIAARTLSEARTGDWQGSAMEIRLSDYDRVLRTALALTPGRFGQDAIVIVRMVSREVRAALGDPLTIFAGPIRRADPTPPLSFTLLLEDVVGHGMLADDHLIPQRRIDADDFPDVEVVEAAQGRPVPIIYGTHSREGGAFAPIYLGVENATDHVWVVAGHYAAVTDVCVEGVSVLGMDPGDWTIPGLSGALVEDYDGRRYTLLRGRAGTAAVPTDPILYAENAGVVDESYFETWISSYPLGGMPPGVGTRWDLNAIADPHGGTYHISGEDLREGELIRGQFGASGPPGTAVPRGYVLDAYTDLVFWIKNGTTPWDVDVTLEITFLVGPPTLTEVGTGVVLFDGEYGFDETNVTTYQEITIPIADFAPDAGARADYLLIRKTGVQEITIALDDITLTGGTAIDAEQTPADRAAGAGAPLTVNVTGWTTTGDEDGDLIEAIAEQYRHFLINYVANPEGYQTGGPLDNPEIDLFDQTVDTVLEASFDTAVTQAVARYPPDGYLGAAILGATASDRLPVRTWIARWNLSADCRFGVNRYGQLFIVMTDPTSADEDAAPAFDETLDILAGTFQVEVGWAVQATRVPFECDFDYVAGAFRVVRDAEDTGLSATYGRPDGILTTPRLYYFVQDSDQAKNVAEHEVQRIGDPPRVLQFETDLGELTTQELGGYIAVRHVAGVAPDAVRLCQIEELSIVVDPRHVRVRAVDVTALIDATTPA